MNNKKNLISAICYQIVTIISGLILPRLLISTFGSDVNGLVSSITQFLSFISLFEGGVGAAVLAELYLPIENKDFNLISKILSACNRFFRNLSILFILYTITLMIFYPIFIANNMSFTYVSSLIFILSINTLMQYMFSITNKLFLQADQKLYLSNIISSIVVILNLLLAVFIIRVFPNIHIVKLGSSLIYLIQPLFYNYYVNRNYDIKKNIRNNNYVIKNRKAAFSQNLAHYINMNTDIVIISMFLSLKDVSIYSVYLLALNALRNIISTGCNSYQAYLGKNIAQKNLKNLKSKFFKFEKTVWKISIILFSTCILLMDPFVSLYTTGINDANYYQPIFGSIMCLAHFVYCIREPYRILVLASGKFKETNFGANMETIINIILSIILVNYIGIIGVAIGTFVAIFYRLVYLVYFLNKNIIYMKIKKRIPLIILSNIMILTNFFVKSVINIHIANFIYFIIYGFIILFLEMFILIVINKIMKLFISKCFTN